MRFMVQSEQVPNLTPAQSAQLYAAMQSFYSQIPEGVILECDYVRRDRLGSYSVLSVPDRATLDRIMAPFAGLVRVHIVEVTTAQEAMGGV